MAPGHGTIVYGRYAIFDRHMHGRTGSGLLVGAQELTASQNQLHNGQPDFERQAGWEDALDKPLLDQDGVDRRLPIIDHHSDRGGGEMLDAFGHVSSGDEIGPKTEQDEVDRGIDDARCGKTVRQRNVGVRKVLLGRTAQALISGLMWSYENKSLNWVVIGLIFGLPHSVQARVEILTHFTTPPQVKPWPLLYFGSARSQG